MVAHERSTENFPVASYSGDIRARLFSRVQVFFMRQPKAMQQPAHARAMRRDAFVLAQFDDRRVQRQVSFPGNTLAHQVRDIVQLASTRITHSPWLRTARLAAQLDQFIHETRRNTKVPSCTTVAMPFTHEGNNPLSKYYRVWYGNR